MPKLEPGKIALCPCRARELGSGKRIAAAQHYDACCGRWHEGYLNGLPAPTPEALMRSRYSAYALAQTNDAQGQAMLRYLFATWHPSTTPKDLRVSATQWTGLDVLRAQYEDTRGVVEFRAWFKVNGKAQQLHERSRFTRENGCWLYLDGEAENASPLA